MNGSDRELDTRRDDRAVGPQSLFRHHAEPAPDESDGGRIIDPSQPYACIYLLEDPQKRRHDGPLEKCLEKRGLSLLLSFSLISHSHRRQCIDISRRCELELSRHARYSTTVKCHRSSAVLCWHRLACVRGALL